MKIVFLDFDGVLNSQLFYEKRKKIKTDDFAKIEAEAERYIDEESIELLNHLIDKTGAKVVVSSSHRVSFTVKELQEILEIKGFEGSVIGKTPKLYFGGLKEYNYSVPRGNEIKAWLEINKGILGQKMEKTRYVIFDDDSDMMLWQRESYFRVDSYTGLTPNLIHRAIRFLNNCG